MKKLLILYASYGTGHRSISHYISDHFKGRGYETMEIDLLDYSNKRITKISKITNDFMARYTPDVWDVIFRATDNKLVGSVNIKLQENMLKSKKLKNTVLEFNPDVVIATHFMGASYISFLKKSRELDTKLITIVTDYKAHQFWLDAHKSEDALIVSSIEEKKNLIKKGIRSSIIKTFGMPVAPNFLNNNYDKSKLLHKFGVTGERPIILFYGGGGNGAKTSLPYLISLIDRKVNADIFFVCGKSEELKHRAEGIVKRHSASNIHVLGFITNGPEYMAISDFVITKPGGITITECLCFKKPMVLISGFGGQENDNYRYLRKKGYAIKAFNVFRFGRVVKKMCIHEEIIDGMQKNLDKREKNMAMDKLYSLVEGMLDES